jgi:bla regulator protein blaR1
MIAKDVLLLQSELIKVPVVIGFLKPVILVPLGLLSQLPTEQVEAVLLHELAHIRRRDYLVNLIQNLAETVFFFNPALLWISELVREERENCCDDIAIGEVENKNEFIHALIAFQEYNLSRDLGNARIAFAGKRNHLLNRVKRIVYNENKKLNAMEKSIFIFSIVTVSLLATISFKELPAQQVRKSETRSEQSQKSTDTIPSKEFTSVNSTVNDDGNTKTIRIEATSKDGKVYRLEKTNDKLTAFSIDGKRVPEDQIDAYDDLIDEIEHAYESRVRESRERLEISKSKLRENQKAVEEKRKALNDRRKEQVDKLKELEKDRQELTEQRQLKIEKENQERLEELKERQLDQMKSNEEMIEKLKHEQENNARRLKEIRKNYTDKYVEQQKKQRAETDELIEKVKKLEEKQNKERKEFIEKIKTEREDEIRKLKNEQEQLRKSSLDNLKTQEKLRSGQTKQLMQGKRSSSSFLNRKSSLFPQQKKIISGYKPQPSQLKLLKDGRLMGTLAPIISDLKDVELLDDSDNYSFELTNDALIVNGKKQSAELHEKFKKKYINHPGDQYKFSQNGGSRSSTIVNN